MTERFTPEWRFTIEYWVLIIGLIGILETIGAFVILNLVILLDF